MAKRATKAPAGGEKPADTNTQGASGTAREAPSAGSGGEEVDTSSGTQSAPPPNSRAPQQAQEDAPGQQAKPEAELADTIGKEAAPASGDVDGSHADDGGSQIPAPETGEVSGDVAAAVTPEAGLSITMEAEHNPPADLRAGLINLTVEVTHEFEVASPIKLDGHHFDIGASLLLTRKLHAELRAAGAIVGNWPED